MKRLVQKAWTTLQKTYALSNEQVAQFQKYLDLLIETNELFNITAITDEESVILDHFYDSCAASKYIEMDNYSTMADVGCGGGFPGIPLKIMYPHIQLYCIEVNKKKAAFLEHVTQELGLDKVTVITDDWRTFLRHATMQVDLFVARASLQVSELLRIFKPSSLYTSSRLVYWASQHWSADEVKVRDIDIVEYPYSVGKKERKLVRFSQESF